MNEKRKYIRFNAEDNEPIDRFLIISGIDTERVVYLINFSEKGFRGIYKGKGTLNKGERYAVITRKSETQHPKMAEIAWVKKVHKNTYHFGMCYLNMVVT